MLSTVLRRLHQLFKVSHPNIFHRLISGEMHFEITNVVPFVSPRHDVRMRSRPALLFSSSMIQLIYFLPPLAAPFILTTWQSGLLPFLFLECLSDYWCCPLNPVINEASFRFIDFHQANLQLCLFLLNSTFTLFEIIYGCFLFITRIFIESQTFSIS